MLSVNGHTNSGNTTMSEHKEQQPDINRRRILRGLGGAPVIMTLSNGAHSAVASQLACIDKNASALQAGLDTAGADANGRYCVPSTDPSLRAIVPPRDGVYDTGDGTPVRSVPGDSIENPPGTITDYSNQHCAFYVDQNGGFAGYTPAAGDAPVTASCYTSFTLP